MTVQPADIDALEEIYKADMILLQLEIPLKLYVHRRQGGEGHPIILDPAPAAEIPDLLFKMAMYVTRMRRRLSSIPASVSG